MAPLLPRIIGCGLAALCGIAWSTVGAAAPPVSPDAAQRSYDAGDFTRARLIWQGEADGGDAQAAYHLGLTYDLGQGTPSDAEAAYHWYLRAAEAGVARAEFNVAVMADIGRGTAHDPARAATWYARAAAHGLARAAYNLAQLYQAGEGVPRNLDVAAAWFEAASAEIPGAAGRPAALRLRHAGPHGPAGEASLVAPDPASPARGSGTSDAPLELVWTAPAEPVPVRYVATLLAREGADWVSVARRTTTLSALVLPQVPGTACYAWRVYSVGISSPHYAAGPWQQIGCTT